MPDPSGGPVNQMFETMELDMTGTLPEAVLEEMLGETPYDLVDVVWGMEVTGDWTDSMTGEGTLQVTDFTEGSGATTRVDLERFTGLQGFHMYNARLQTDSDHVFTLSAAFPAEEGGVALGTEIDGVKSIFEVTWLCHMFEPDRRGCIDYPDEYYETDLPVLSKLHVQRRSGGYKIDFEARVHELRTHRDLGYTKTEISGRFADVRGWVCDRASWEDDPEDCVGETVKGDRHSQEAFDWMVEEIRRVLAEVDDEAARVWSESVQAELERQMQKHIDRVETEIKAETARVQAEMMQAEAERQMQNHIDRVKAEMQAEVERLQSEIVQAQTERRVQEHFDEVQAQLAAEIARAGESHDAALAEAEAAYSDFDASEDAEPEEHEADQP
ncbi:MAG: hypothetical protein LC676_05740 [Loktanella sp.]|nr:hypothetical protein [Loktanella sp.]